MSTKSTTNTRKSDATPTAQQGDVDPSVALFAGDESSGAYQVFARRYRSRSFDEVIGQDSIANTLRTAIKLKRTAHAYLFCGTRGVGKTSMARIFARALNAVETQSQSMAVGDAIMRGEDLDVIEIDGASNRGVDDARDLIAGASIAPARSPFKIYIIDEVHMLTQPAFNALLKTMEEPPAHVKFILCTTEPHKVPATIQSRCQRFDFRAIPSTAIAAHLKSVLSAEKMTADEAVVVQVARLANGSMRDGLSLLDRLVSSAAGHVSTQHAREVLGLPDEELLDSVLASICQGDPTRGLQSAGKLIEQGMSPDHAIDTIASRLRDTLIIRTCGVATDLVDLPAETKEAIGAHAAVFDPPGIVHLIALCDASVRNIRGSSIPRVIFDAVVARLCMADRFASGAEILATGLAKSSGGSSGVDAIPKKKVSESFVSQKVVTAALPTPKVVAPVPSDATIAAPAPNEPKSVVPSASKFDEQAFKRNPLVREAAEILDAAIGRVTPIAREGS